MKAKTWFNSKGRRAASLGLSLNSGRSARYAWPEFARRAYAAGWLQQSMTRRQQENGNG